MRGRVTGHLDNGYNKQTDRQTTGHIGPARAGQQDQWIWLIPDPINKTSHYCKLPEGHKGHKYSKVIKTIKGQQSQYKGQFKDNKVRPRSARKGQSKVSKISLRSERPLQNQQGPSKVSPRSARSANVSKGHNFNNACICTEWLTWSSIELLRTAKKI